MEDKQEMFSRMNQDRESLIDGIIQLVYFMRGSVQYKHMLDTSPFERAAFARFIEKRLEQEGKKMHPQY